MANRDFSLDRFFTPDEDATIVQMWAEGHPTSAIGRALGRTKSSVISRTRKLPVVRRESPIKSRTYVVKSTTEEQEQRIRTFRAHGNSVRKTADVLGISRHVVRRVCPPTKQERIEKALKARKHTAEAKPMPAEPRPPSIVYTRAAARPGNGCRFPLWGDKQRPTHLYCGKQIYGFGSWCPKCRDKVFNRSAESVAA